MTDKKSENKTLADFALQYERWLAKALDSALGYLDEEYGYPVVTDETELDRLRNVYELAYMRGFQDGQDGKSDRPGLP